MTIEFIKEVLQNKINNLNNLRFNAYNSGDLELIARIDAEIIETQTSLNKLP
jgi:hypothetical protein